MAFLRSSGLILPSEAKITRPCLFSSTTELAPFLNVYDTRTWPSQSQKMVVPTFFDSFRIESFTNPFTGQ